MAALEYDRGCTFGELMRGRAWEALKEIIGYLPVGNTAYRAIRAATTRAVSLSKSIFSHFYATPTLALPLPSVVKALKDIGDGLLIEGAFSVSATGRMRSVEAVLLPPVGIP